MNIQVNKKTYKEELFKKFIMQGTQFKNWKPVCMNDIIQFMVSDIGRFETICSAILPTSLLFWFYLITLKAEKSFNTIEGKVTIVLFSRVQLSQNLEVSVIISKILK